MSDRVAVVTGAGRGIGAAIARRLAAEGWAVVVADSGAEVDGSGYDPDPAEEVAGSIWRAGGSARPVVADVTTRAGLDFVLETAMSLGQPAALVHAAGTIDGGSVTDLSDESWRSVLAVHLDAAFAAARAFWPVFQREGSGRIVLVGGADGLVGQSGQANYAAAKAGQLGLMRALALEGERVGITANLVLPSAETRQGPAGDAKADDVAPLVAWLCSPGGGSVSGQVLGVRGAAVTVWSQPRPTGQLLAPAGWDTETLDALGSGAATGFFPLEVGDGFPGPAIPVRVPPEPPAPEPEAQAEPDDVSAWAMPAATSGTAEAGAETAAWPAPVADEGQDDAGLGATQAWPAADPAPQDETVPAEATGEPDAVDEEQPVAEAEPAEAEEESGPGPDAEVTGDGEGARAEAADGGQPEAEPTGPEAAVETAETAGTSETAEPGEATEVIAAVDEPAEAAAEPEPDAEVTGDGEGVRAADDGNQPGAGAAEVDLTDERRDADGEPAADTVEHAVAVAADAGDPSSGPGTLAATSPAPGAFAEAPDAGGARPRSRGRRSGARTTRVVIPEPEPEPDPAGADLEASSGPGERPPGMPADDPDWVVALDSMAEPEASPFFDEEPPARRTLLGRRRPG